MVFLAPHEDSYVEFMRLRNVPLQPLAAAEDAKADELFDKIRKYGG